MVMDNIAPKICSSKKSAGLATFTWCYRVMFSGKGQMFYLIILLFFATPDHMRAWRKQKNKAMALPMMFASLKLKDLTRNVFYIISQSSSLSMTTENEDRR